MDLKFKLSLFFLCKLQYSDAYSLHALKSLKWLTEAFRRHWKDTTYREVSNFIVAFQRKTEIVFVRNSFKSIQALTLTSYSTFQLVTGDFEPEHAALIKVGSKRVYVSVSVKHNCTRCYGISRWSLPWLKIVNEQTVFWVAIDSDLPYEWTVKLFAVARRDMYPSWSSLIAIISERHVFQGSK